MKPFTLRVRSTNVLPKRLPLVQRFASALPVSTPKGRGVIARRWTCDEYLHARARGVRSFATIAPLFSLKLDASAMSNLTPPQPPATWTHTPEQVTTLINELIAKDRAGWDKVGSLSPKDCNFESVCPPVLYANSAVIAKRSRNVDRFSLSNPHDTLVGGNLLIHLYLISSQ